MITAASSPGVDWLQGLGASSAARNSGAFGTSAKATTHCLPGAGWSSSGENAGRPLTDAGATTLRPCLVSPFSARPGVAASGQGPHRAPLAYRDPPC
jgi:hypothetical protein